MTNIMAKTLYLECSSGISGDMAVAALLDLGADPQVLHDALASLPVQGFSTHISRVSKSGLDVCDFEVRLDEAHENHDHDMDYLYGHDHHHDQRHSNDHSPRGDEGHHHRGLKEVTAIIKDATLSDHARELALSVFTIIAEAEAKAHGLPLDQVHFHEVGAIDSIVDIVSFAVCLDNLCVDDVVVPGLYDGRGSVRCQHGLIPVPVPAVVNIVTAHHLPLHILDIDGELITPTGAAIVAAVRTKDSLPLSFTIQRVGMGAGKRIYETPGILRALLIDPH